MHWCHGVGGLSLLECAVRAPLLHPESFKCASLEQHVLCKLEVLRDSQQPMLSYHVLLEGCRTDAALMLGMRACHANVSFKHA